MKAYALDKYGEHRCGVICMYMRTMRNEKTLIKCAPSRFTLKQFGGPLTIEEFRKNSTNTIKIGIPDLDHKIYSVVVQSKPELHTQNNSDGKLNSIMTTQCSNEPLNLKRTKPLRRDRDNNNLEKTLGLTIKKNSFLTVGGPGPG